ncbi:ubiquitin-activating enzyme [Blastocystis sp. subtype 4]|uniref:ubiquitin-activating enzyme n=1 Tax=Blastocystis sp. subtype 4 TaxID=944170 RepID=UPI0007118D99|nr:ubiquitin-activating enzyme [Blastocystis sp. subtype 4]KNB45104.1 ubiquitin-activating enzyme [Blastocystis sp. subtype 4]|eukprot:XP_014528547.1 ubiquitin-activating enzyme [Blastocystis sp. subtype 4]
MSNSHSLYDCLCTTDIGDRIVKAKVLVVGAGGIGCEILKNLVIDLDTIEMSNLNRQFLFRKEHIGQSKAIVAAKAVLLFHVKDFGDGVEIDAEHANIMNPKFDLFFFKSFNIVFNALDNVKARQYVNSMCVLANVPLIEGGSTGLLGQSYPIIPHQTECYNCRPRGGDEGEKYAICTIRSTPEKIEHNIVWAKELFVLLFGETSESLLFEEVDSVYMQCLKPTSSTVVKDDKKCLDFCTTMLEALFDKEIEKRLQIGSYATISQQPIPVGIRSLVGEFDSKANSYDVVWDVKTCVNVLLLWIWKYYKEGKYVLKEIEESVHSFDKDNHGDIVIVAAATNISSSIHPVVS